MLAPVVQLDKNVSAHFLGKRNVAQSMPQCGND